MKAASNLRKQGAERLNSGALTVMNEFGSASDRVPIFLLQALAPRKTLSYLLLAALALADEDC